ncbi:MAG: hypothetical protein AAF297_04325 [Planctomycetota bacterium]
MQNHGESLSLSDGSRDRGVPRIRSEMLAARREIRRGLTEVSLRDAVAETVADRVLTRLAADLDEQDRATPVVEVPAASKSPPVWINPSWQLT